MASAMHAVRLHCCRNPNSPLFPPLVCKCAAYYTKCKQVCHRVVGCLFRLFHHVSRCTLTMAVQFVMPLFTSVPLLTMAEVSHRQLIGIVTNTAPAPDPRQCLVLFITSSALALMMIRERRPCQQRGCSRRCPAAPDPPCASGTQGQITNEECNGTGSSGAQLRGTSA